MAMKMTRGNVNLPAAAMTTLNQMDQSATIQRYVSTLHQKVEGSILIADHYRTVGQTSHSILPLPTQ